MLYDERRNWELYWLVDPLDGTVEFIKGNNEFTVNIALMENNVCMGAVIYVPYFEKLYIAGRDAGSYVKEHVAPDSGAEYTYDEIVTGWTRLPLECEAVRPHPRLRVAVSRSHQTPETAEHIAACARRTPTWRSSNRAVRISSACWPRGGSTIMSARRILTSGTRRPGS